MQINIGATGSQFGRYSYVISGIDPDEVYAAADALGEKLRDYPGFAGPPRSDLFRATARPGHRNRSRSRQHVRRFDCEAPEPPPRRLFAELCLFDQEAGRPISGHPRGRRCRPRTIREDLRAALRETRRNGNA